MTTTAIGASLEHPLGAEGLVSIRLRDGDVRIRAVDSDRVTIRDVDGHDLSGMFAIVLGEGSVSLRSIAVSIARSPSAAGRRPTSRSSCRGGPRSSSRRPARTSRSTASPAISAIGRPPARSSCER